MKDRWISVRDRLPEDQQKILTYWPSGHTPIQVQKFYLQYGGDGPWWMFGWENHLLSDGDITHWMPLPDSPSCQPELFDKEFVGEACRLWRALYGSEVAIYQAARFFASRVTTQKAKGLRFIARNALRLAIVLDELAQELQEENGADSV